MRRLAAVLAAALLAGCTTAPSQIADDPDAAIGAADKATVSPGPLPASPPLENATTPAPSAARSSATTAPTAPAGAGEPAALGAQIAAAEAAVRDESLSAQAVAEAAAVQQAAYRRLGANPEWLDAVLAEVPPPLHTAVHRNLGAQLELGRLGGGGPTELPDWQILAPEPPEALLGYYAEAEAAFGVPWRYLAAIHLVETRMGRILGLSSAGAQGPMQFIPETWARYGSGDVNDNRDAILSAGRYLAASDAPEDMPGALFSYNNSNRYVRAISYYAEVLADDPHAYHGYYHWQVYYALASGTVLLPEGYPAVAPIPAS